MDTAKILKKGKSQVMNLPDKYRFLGDEGFIYRVGNAVVLLPKDDVWETFLSGLNSFSNGMFENGR